MVRKGVDGPSSGHTPNNPTKAPSVPTGPSATPKSSPSKVMKPMGKK